MSSNLYFDSYDIERAIAQVLEMKMSDSVFPLPKPGQVFISAGDPEAHDPSITLRLPGGKIIICAVLSITPNGILPELAFDIQDATARELYSTRREEQK